MPQKVGKYDSDFRIAKPETIGETDHTFDLSGYVDFLESKIPDKDWLRIAIDFLEEDQERYPHDVRLDVIEHLKRCRLTDGDADATHGLSRR